MAQKTEEYGGCIGLEPHGKIERLPTALHDWRLESRRWTAGRSGYSYWQETWYCTRCRRVEERGV